MVVKKQYVHKFPHVKRRVINTPMEKSKSIQIDRKKNDKLIKEVTKSMTLNRRE
jgi:hypothetical protein